MRLSGNYFDRLFVCIVPWTFIACLIIHFSTGDTTERTIILFLILTAALWLQDTLFIFIKYKKPEVLRYTTVLQRGKRVIASGEIVKIRPFRDKRYRWSFDMIEFSLSDGNSFYIISKPVNIISSLAGRPSKTIRQLIALYPELGKKIST